MKLTIDSKELKSTLKAVKAWIPTKPILPIMECVWIDSDDHGTHITAFNFNPDTTAIRFPAEAFTNRSGACIVRFKDLQDITAKSEGAVTLEYDNIYTLTVAYDSTTFTLKAKPTDEFPMIPAGWFNAWSDSLDNFATAFSSFIQAVDHVHIATESSAARNFTSGILFSVKPGEVNLVGTDGRRLHYSSLSAYATYTAESADWSALIHADTVKLISKLPANPTDEIKFGRRFVQDTEYFAFEVGNIEGFTIPMDTPYPEWQAVIPDSHSGALIISSDVLLKSVDRLSPICKADDGRDFVKLSGNGVLTISARSETKGTGESVLKCDHVTGDDLLVGLNYSFLQDSLKLHKGESVRLMYAGQLDPIMIRSAVDDSRTSILMPVRLPE